MNDILNSIFHFFLTGLALFISHIGLLTQIIAFFVVLCQLAYWIGKALKGFKKDV